MSAAPPLLRRQTGPKAGSNRGLRLAAAGGVAVLLLTGALNVSGLLRAEPAWAVDPAAPSAVDALVGRPAPGATALDGRIAALQDTLRAEPAVGAGRAATLLADAYLQKARETGDPSWYPKAETLFAQALDEEPNDADALAGMGTLDLARHRFADALTWGERAREANPWHAPTRGVIVDALVELGRYDEAVIAAQEMVDLRPDLASYARVSYLRELHGDRAGAIAAMEQAAVAGAAYPENVAWARAQLGLLRLHGGDRRGADREFAAALAVLPGYVPAVVGQARVDAASGDLDAALVGFADAATRLPSAEHAAAYGDALAAVGRDQEAAAQYAVVEAIQQLQADAGVDVDLELALFRADQGDPEDAAAAAAQARTIVAERPSVTAWQTLAWAAFKSGDLDEAGEAIAQALRLGGNDPRLLFHAGAIAAARGERDAAIGYLDAALTANPAFSLRDAAEARAMLTRLRAEETDR
jgi:tetratricopeptide (TPR) repeat protein